jgi:hypothetical protein
MLTDHRQEQERRASDARRYRRVIKEYGSFIAWLRLWVWFVTITFRDWPGAVAPTANRELETSSTQSCDPDPRIGTWQPSQRGFHHGDPGSDLTRTMIKQFFTDVQQAAGRAISWVIAEDYGRLAGRFHAHALVDGVEDLDIDHWRAEACRRFGISRIAPYDPLRGAARYLARNALSANGNLHFGGTLAGLEIDTGATREVGRVVIARSADVPSPLFHLTLGRKRIR